MPKHPGSIWIAKNYDTLPRKEWIAADKNGLIAHDITYDGLIQQLQSKNVSLSDVVKMFVPEDMA